MQNADLYKSAMEGVFAADSVPLKFDPDPEVLEIELTKPYGGNFPIALLSLRDKRICYASRENPDDGRWCRVRTGEDGSVLEQKDGTFHLRTEGLFHEKTLEGITEESHKAILAAEEGPVQETTRGI